MAWISARACCRRSVLPSHPHSTVHCPLRTAASCCTAALRCTLFVAASILSCAYHARLQSPATSLRGYAIQRYCAQLHLYKCNERCSFLGRPQARPTPQTCQCTAESLHCCIVQLCHVLHFWRCRAPGPHRFDMAAALCLPPGLPQQLLLASSSRLTWQPCIPVAAHTLPQVKLTCAPMLQPSSLLA